MLSSKLSVGMGLLSMFLAVNNDIEGFDLVLNTSEHEKKGWEENYRTGEDREV